MHKLIKGKNNILNNFTFTRAKPLYGQTETSNIITRIQSSRMWSKACISGKFSDIVPCKFYGRVYL